MSSQEWRERREPGQKKGNGRIEALRGGGGGRKTGVGRGRDLVTARVLDDDEDVVSIGRPAHPTVVWKPPGNGAPRYGTRHLRSQAP